MFTNILSPSSEPWCNCLMCFQNRNRSLLLSLSLWIRNITTTQRISYHQRGRPRKSGWWPNLIRLNGYYRCATNCQRKIDPEVWSLVIPWCVKEKQTNKTMTRYHLHRNELSSLFFDPSFHQRNWRLFSPSSEMLEWITSGVSHIDTLLNSADEIHGCVLEEQRQGPWLSFIDIVIIASDRVDKMFYRYPFTLVIGHRSNESLKADNLQWHVSYRFYSYRQPRLAFVKQTFSRTVFFSFLRAAVVSFWARVGRDLTMETNWSVISTIWTAHDVLCAFEQDSVW